MGRRKWYNDYTAGIHAIGRIYIGSRATMIERLRQYKYVFISHEDKKVIIMSFSHESKLGNQHVTIKNGNTVDFSARSILNRLCSIGENRKSLVGEYPLHKISDHEFYIVLSEKK